MPATFYIDPATGSDTQGDGSYVAPWQTVVRAYTYCSDNGLTNALVRHNSALVGIWPPDEVGAELKHAVTAARLRGG